MKHIVHVSNDFAPMSAGINTHLQSLLPEITKQGFQVTLLVPTASNDEKIEDIYEDNSWEHFTCVRANYPGSTNVISKLLYLTKSTKAGLRWIEKEIGRIDLIHQHDQRATRLGASHYAKKNNVSVIWTNHSPDYFGNSELFTRLIPKFFRLRPDGLIAVHRSMAELFWDSEYSDLPVQYISNGVDTNKFRTSSKDRKSSDFVILFPQRLVPMKGPSVLAKAVTLICRKNDNTNFSIWFAGDKLPLNRDNNTTKKVKTILNSSSEEYSVKFLGNPQYQQMPSYYRQADIVVLPLQVETENISIFEAWASGTPLITTKQVEKNGYMVHEENCLIVPNNDPHKMADAILRLSKDLELRQKLAANGREWVQNRFRWSQVAEKTSEFYREVFKKRNV